VRVKRCPNCQEPLPGAAKFCGKCGEYLSAPGQSSNNNYKSQRASAVKIAHRPAALKVSRFSTVDTDPNIITQHLYPPMATNSVKSRQSSLFSDNEIMTPVEQIDDRPGDDDDYEMQRRATWNKIVTYKTPRVPIPPPSVAPPDPITPIPVEPAIPGPPAGSNPPALIQGRQAPPKQPRRVPTQLFSWISILVLVGLSLGGIFGLVVSFSRGILTQPSHNNGVLSLQVTPSTVALGGIITLRGSSFSPSVRVGLTRDTNIAVLDTSGENIIHTDKGGSFSDTVIVDPAWRAGAHILRAEDAVFHKFATFTVIVTGQSTSLRPAHLLFSTNAIDLGSGDQATNSTQKVTLSNAGGGQISWQATATQPWLLISPHSGTFSNGQNIQVEIAGDRSNLEVGKYVGSIIFTSNTLPTALPVKMTVTQLQPGHEAVLQLTPATLSFTGTDGSTSPAGQVVTVSNPGVLSLQWSASSSTNDGSSWLSAYPQSGTVTNGSSQAVTIGVNTSTLLPGVYEGSVTFTSPDSSTKDSPQTIYISLTVVPQCGIQVSPGGLTFAGVYLQAPPAQKVINVSVSQECSTALRWSTVVTTNNGGHWLNIDQASGVTPAYPSVSVVTMGLNPGTYTGAVIFSWPGGSETLPVTFIMGQSLTPLVAAAPATMLFSGSIGKPSPLPQKATITNSGSGTLTWHAAAATTVGGAWLAIAQRTGTLAPHQSVPITVTATLLKTLTAGTYTATITITGTDSAGHLAAGSPQSIPVTFVVQAQAPGCTLKAPSVTAEAFSTKAGTNPAAQTFTVSIRGGCTGPVTVTPTATMTNGTGWLAVTPASATVASGSKGTFTVTITSAALAAGKYRGTISLAAVNAGVAITGSPQTVDVKLRVLGGPSLTVGPGLTFNISSGRDSQPININNTGDGPLNWTATLGSDAPSFVSLSADSGKNLAGGTTATINVLVDATGVPGGSKFKTSVFISAIDPINGQPVAGSPSTVPITINIPPSPTPSPTSTPSPSPTPTPTPSPPQMTLSSNNLAFTTTAGKNPGPQTINIQNSGGGKLKWTTGAPSRPWLTVTPKSGSDAAGQSTSITFNVNVAGMAAGTYRAKVVITPSVGNAVKVTVTLTIN
jgi:Viral BACON domain